METSPALFIKAKTKINAALGTPRSGSGTTFSLNVLCKPLFGRLRWGGSIFRDISRIFFPTHYTQKGPKKLVNVVIPHVTLQRLQN